jgi:Ca2+-transporting ATPase
MPALDIGQVEGLNDREAEEKLRSEGYNELPAASRRGALRIVIEVVHEPIFLLLVASGLLYFMLGDITEGLMLMTFVLVVIGITVYQERKTERALEALRNLSSPRALVIRNGVQRLIPGQEVVTEEVVLLS